VKEKKADQPNKCEAQPSSLFPHAIGVEGNASGGVAVFDGLLGAAGTLSGGGGLFFGGGSPVQPGAWGTGGGFAGTPVVGVAYPGGVYGPNNPHSVVGRGASASANIVLSNATAPQQVSGVFRHFQLGPASFAYGNGVWVLSIAFFSRGPGSFGWAGQTNTKVAGGC